MSWRALEGLVDDSLALIDAVGAGCDGRSLAASLFAFSDRHDTQFTRFRDMPRLERLGYVYRLAPEAHPGAAADAALLAAWRAPGGLGADDLVWVGGEDAPLPVPGPGTGTAYVARQDPAGPVTLFVEAGSSTWAALVAAGVLQGPAAAPVALRRPLDLAVELAALAAERGDGELVAAWYALITCELDDLSPASLKRNPQVKRLRALAGPFAEPLAAFAQEVRDTLCDEELADWWLAPGPAAPAPAPDAAAVAAALASLRHGRDDLAEYPPTAGDYLQRACYGAALAVLERMPEPPLAELVALVLPASSPSPWGALFAARVLRKQAKAFYKAPDASARLAALLDAVDETPEAHFAYEDAGGDDVGSFVLELAAKGGAKARGVVVARAAAARARGERDSLAWRVAALSAGKAHEALWAELAAAHGAAVAAGQAPFDPVLYDMIALDLVCTDKLPVTTDWLAAVVAGELPALLAEAQVDPSGARRLGFLAKLLGEGHPALAAALSPSPLPEGEGAR